MALNIRLNTRVENIHKFYELYKHIKSNCSLIKDYCYTGETYYVDSKAPHKVRYTVEKGDKGVITIFQQIVVNEEINETETVCSFDNQGNYKTYFATI